MGRQTLADLDFEALENTARRAALQLAARVIQHHLNADHTDGSDTHRACSCGRSARLVARRRKCVQSALGPLELERAYYHCAQCGAGFCPRDRSLGIELSSVSPAVLRMIGTVGAMVSFEEGSALLEELAGVKVETKQVERLAEKLGAEAAEDEKRSSESLDSTPLPQTLYLGLDGTGLPMRASELAGRRGKQADGSGKTREVKLCTILERGSARTR